MLAHVDVEVAFCSFIAIDKALLARGKCSFAAGKKSMKLVKVKCHPFTGGSPALMILDVHGHQAYQTIIQ